MTETTWGKIIAIPSNRFVHDLYIIQCLPSSRFSVV